MTLAEAGVAGWRELCGSVRPAVRVPMRDGALAALTLWLPMGDGPFPVVLTTSLSRRRVTIDHPNVRSLLGAGFAVASADARGRFESEGELDPTYGEQSGRDMHDTVEWLAAQPWCTGAAGTFGGSHRAYYQTSMARTGAPAGLKAMATWTGGYRAGRTESAGPPMSGGVTALGTTLIWLPNEAGGVLDRLAATGVDVAAAKSTLARMRTHPRETFEHLPLLEAPITRFGDLRELFAYRLARTSVPGNGVASPPGEVITTPVFHEAGWFDHAAWMQIETFSRLRAEAGTAAARAGQHIVLGPWPHGMSFAERLGDMYFGPEAGSAASPVEDLHVRFFQKYVTGADVDLPAVTYFVMGRNEWRTSDVWPPAGVSRRRLYLRAGGAAGGGAGGDGLLSADAPGDDEAADEYLYDPADPVPTLGGALDWQLVIPGMIAGPVEQGPVEERADVLCYTTEPLRAAAEISGPVVLNLFASTSAVDTDFTAKLCQVLPDGRSYNIQEGILRLSGRNLLGRRESVTPGEVYELRIGVGQTSVVVEAGSRLRLQVTSSNFPHWDRNMNTGNPVGTDATGIIARQAVHHAGNRASYLELPMTEIGE